MTILLALACASDDEIILKPHTLEIDLSASANAVTVSQTVTSILPCSF
jgi:hypothetical protein